MEFSKLYQSAGIGVLLFLAACSTEVSGQVPASGGTEEGQDNYRIVTLLPRDAIPAIDDPIFLSTTEADAEYAAEELVMGVVFNDDARAYSVNLLSGHEIVNDTVGGKKIAVTW